MVVTQTEERRTPAPPLFVAIHAYCNLSCFFCCENGENRFLEPQGPLSKPRLLRRAQLLDLLEIAYEKGVRTFRLTGGEPTLRSDLGELLIELQALGEDVRIAMTTNGFRLARVVDVLRTLKKPRIFLSLDGIDDEPAETGFPIARTLTPELEETLEQVCEFAQVRINYVLTRSSAHHLMALIEFARARSIDLKIFELLSRDFYFVGGRDPSEIFDREYLSVREYLPRLQRRFGDAIPFGGTGGRGIPMKAFRTGTSRVIYFDSAGGSHYGDACHNDCLAYPCQEGLYAMMLDADGTLHPAGCQKRELYMPLRGVDRDDALAAFDALRNLMLAAEFEEVIPRPLLHLVHNA